jgi:hypothetical protein
MGSEQKYTEEEFEIDEFFLHKMKNFEISESIKIAHEIDSLYGTEPTDGDVISGYVNDKEGDSIFFSISYYREEDGPIVLIDLNEIELDEYLDAINLNKHIKNGI